MASESARKALSPDPWTQLQAWVADATQKSLPIPEAMTLATASRAGIPSIRNVLFKGISNGALLFFTNYGSRKARELDENPVAAVAFHWHALERQILIEGTVERATRLESETYFHSRPRESQIGAYASHQGVRIESAEALHERFEHFRAQFGNDPIPLPEFWGGYRLKPKSFEFWSGGTARLHDRFVYLPQADGSWDIHRLSP